MSADRPGALPKGGATLSERIAALQRKTSNPKPVSRAGGLSPGSSHGSSSGRLSPGDSPSRLGGGNGSASAVRDRIAKFQGNDDRPVVPRGSFGVGAPNPELLGGSRRGYPGACAKGSGAWGEGVLRPQMTGGVWLGAGSGGGWGDPANAPMRPQLTGGAFLNNGGRIPSFGSGSSRMYRGASSEMMPGAGRDAFADLDPDIVLTGRNKPDDEDLSAAAPSGLTQAPSLTDAYKRDGLPTLPDPPATEVDLTKVKKLQDGMPSIDGNTVIPDFPTTPSAAPETPKKQLALPQGTPDTSIEIGVHGRSPQDVEKIRKKARDLELDNSAPLSAENGEPWIPQPGTKPAGEVPKPLDPSEVAAASSAEVKDSGEPWVQGYGKPDATVDARALEPGAEADPNAPGDLPQRAQVERTTSGKVDPNDPNAHKVMGAGLLVPRDEVAEARASSGSTASVHSEDDGLAGVGASMAQPSSATSDESASFDSRFRQGGPMSASSRHDSSAPTSPPTSRFIGSNGSASADLANGRPSMLGAPNGASAASIASPTSSSGTHASTAAERARQAVAEARSKSKGSGSSQRLRRPPPGTVLSAADLDASDDEYEPGWASVISSSRS